jgi:hypothetical protein
LSVIINNRLAEKHGKEVMKMKKALNKLWLQVFCKKEFLLSKLADTTGSGMFEEGSKVIIGIVIAVLILGAAIALIQGDVIPGVKDKIKAIFDTDTSPT